MKNVARLICILFFLPVLICSCYSSRYVYSPNAHNVPVLVSKGDSKAAINYSSNLNGKSATNLELPQVKNKGTGLDIQGAYAVTDHFAIQSSYAYRSEMNIAENNLHGDTSILKYKRHLTELGLGYYTGMDKSGIVIFQVFAGAGLGKSSLADNYTTGSTLNRFLNMNVTKLYIQPAFIFRFTENINISFSNRVSFIYFGNVATNYTDEELTAYKLKDLGSKKRVFYEPAFLTAFGFDALPGIQFGFQYGMSFITGGTYSDHRGLNFSAGVSADLSKVFGSGTQKAKTNKR